MNRFIRGDTTLFRRGDSHDDEEEEQLYERRALIDDQELCDDEINLFSANPIGIRHRQQSNRSISADMNKQGEHELRTLNGYNNKTRDIISEPIVEFTYYDIQPGDSLHSICLRYACSVNQVKRLNNLMTDQEFYGLRKIKLPLGRLGLLEDVLKEQITKNSSNNINNNNNNNNHVLNENSTRHWTVNSPGSALSVSTRHSPQFKPLLSPGFSSDKISELNRQDHLMPNPNGKDVKMQHNHSHSFSSMRDFASTNIDIEPQQYGQDSIQIRGAELKQQNFIKSNLDQTQDIDIDNDIVASNEKVFEDLDFHVERVKAVAETYDQRATEIVNRIDINGNPAGLDFHRQRVSKIPGIFYCNESFGLNYKKLIVFIFIVCLIIPLIYINQSTNIVTTQT